MDSVGAFVGVGTVSLEKSEAPVSGDPDPETLSFRPESVLESMGRIRSQALVTRMPARRNDRRTAMVFLFSVKYPADAAGLLA